MGKSWKDALRQKTSTRVTSVPKTNPFELKYSKSAFDVLGKMGSGAAVGKPGASRRRAEEIRRNTLLKEYKSIGKTSKLVDKRFGRGIEDDDEAALGRFSLARSRKESKRSMYQLSDDDSANDDLLTHRGQSLTSTNMNDFIDADDGADAPRPSDNFGGFEEPKKTKAEAMKELISKSKYYKMERQRVKEENEAIRGDIDASFDVIRRNLLTEQNRHKGKLDDDEAETPLEFDSAVKRLALEKRLAAQNEVKKTPEEIRRAQLEKEFKKAQELRKRISDGAIDEAGESLHLSRKVLAAERELSSLVESLCKSSSVEEANKYYRQIIDGIAASSHRQILLAKVCRGKIERIFKAFTNQALKGKAVINKPSSFIMLRLIGNVFSTCDFHHIVSTPAHLCGLYLIDYAQITKVRHFVNTLCIAECLLSFQEVSKRYIPEVMNLLYSLFLYTTEQADRKGDTFLVKPISCNFTGDLEFSTGNILSNADDISRSSFVRQLSMIVLKAAHLYYDLAAFPEMFEPFTELLSGESGEELRQLVTDHATARQPLLLQDHKPVPLPQLEPFIEDDLVVGHKRSKKLDDPHREIQRLRAACRKESRSAQRELRKDASFLARERLTEQKAKDAEYRERVKRLYGTLANEEASR